MFLLFILGPVFSHAGWSVNAERAGFLGKLSLGAGYHESDHHFISMLLGVSNIAHENTYQASFVYNYAHWAVRNDNRVWYPVQVGFFITHSLNSDRYFTKSPGQYPDPAYYDQTALRGGFDFASGIKFESTQLGVTYHFRILDTGFVAIYNNARKDLQYSISSSLALQYYF